MRKIQKQIKTICKAAVAASAFASLFTIAGYSNLASAQSTALEKIAKRGELIAGSRRGTAPISDIVGGKAQGLGIDLCTRIYEEIKTKLNLPNLKLRWQEVNGANRVTDILDGKVDLDCGTTYITKARLEQIDYTYPYFISRTTFMAKDNAKIKEFKNVGVFKDAQVIVKSLESYKNTKLLNFNINKFASNEAGLEALAKGSIDAYFGDDLGIWATSEAMTNFDSTAFSLHDETVAFYPVGIGFPKDAEFRKTIDLLFVNMYKSGEMNNLLKHWFEKERKSPLKVNRFTKEAFKKPSRTAASN